MTPVRLGRSRVLAKWHPESLEPAFGRSFLATSAGKISRRKSSSHTRSYFWLHVLGLLERDSIMLAVGGDLHPVVGIFLCRECSADRSRTSAVAPSRAPVGSELFGRETRSYTSRQEHSSRAVTRPRTQPSRGRRRLPGWADRRRPRPGLRVSSSLGRISERMVTLGQHSPLAPIRPMRLRSCSRHVQISPVDAPVSSPAGWSIVWSTVPTCNAVKPSNAGRSH